MATEDSFGRRLRRERERRQISLSSISANTKISPALFEALEREDVSRWPKGIFRRAFIRAYAENIGLDADAVVREFLERFPDPAAPPVSRSVDCPTPSRARIAPLRLTLADAGAPTLARAFADMRRRLIAVVCDAAAVTAVAGAAYVATGRLWLPLAISTFSYYCAGVVLLGNTPGMSLQRHGARRDATPSRWVGVRGLMTGADALRVRFNRAASAPDSGVPLRSEPGTSGS